MKQDDKQSMFDSSDRIGSIMERILNTLLSITGVFFAFIGSIAITTGDYLCGSLVMIAGLILVPFVRSTIARLSNTPRIRGAISIVVFFGLIIIMCSTLPSTENTSDVGIEQAPPTPIPTPIPTPTEITSIAPEDATTESDLSIGETASSHSTDITITDMVIIDHYYWTGDSGNYHIVQPDRGDIFVIITCNIKRTGSGSYNYYSHNFWLLDSDGYRYDKEYYYGDNELERNQELHTGQQTQGVLLFEVPASMTGLKAQYEFSGLFSSDIVSWVIHP
jgi:hypothetical protein